jgi:hypothetical protein
MAAERNANRALLPFEMERLIQEIFPSMTRSDYFSVVGSEPSTRREFNATLDAKLTRQMKQRLQAAPIQIYPNDQVLETHFGFGYKPKTLRELGWALKTIPELQSRNTSWMRMAGELGEKKVTMRPVHTELLEKMGAPERFGQVLGDPNAPVNEAAMARMEELYEGGPVVEGEGKAYPYPKQYAIKLPRSRRASRKNRKSRKSRKSRRN